MTKIANFFVCHNVKAVLGVLSVRAAFVELFTDRKFEINMMSGRSGKIKAVKSITSKQTSFEGSFSLLFVEPHHQENPSEKWDFLCFHDDAEGTVCIGDASSKDKDLAKWSADILKKLGRNGVASDYAYAYRETIPFGQAYSVGVFAEDDLHPITDFATAEEISLWLKNGRFDAQHKKIRDVFRINMFSDSLYKNIAEFCGNTSIYVTKSEDLIHPMHIMECSLLERNEVRMILKSKGVLIAAPSVLPSSQI
ncbi:hypothetical protein RMR16_024615 (plasmid) [Agrobacterium sp. rho-13.3]|uniref:hypothetical protein n=1 Tax=Agrobacterium sp. rho-13.3 TaxID=3072980 RepID=UPI002A0B14BA|nr:hypothetical protein [Agrobacterium sp. rho-13.3]MDX8310136.1 hypothetical protein [Agrobacterium sp. rho-13.3]